MSFWEVIAMLFICVIYAVITSMLNVFCARPYFLNWPKAAILQSGRKVLQQFLHEEKHLSENTQDIESLIDVAEKSACVCQINLDYDNLSYSLEEKSWIWFPACALFYIAIAAIIYESSSAVGLLWSVVYLVFCIAAFIFFMRDAKKSEPKEFDYPPINCDTTTFYEMCENINKVTGIYGCGYEIKKYMNYANKCIKKAQICNYIRFFFIVAWILEIVLH